jgi:hypothetical protein
MLSRLFEEQAMWFSVPALVGTGVFLLRMLFMLLGGDHGADVGAADGGVLDATGGLDSGGHDATGAFTVLSVQSLAAFAAGFGWAGVGALLGMGASVPAAAGVGVAGGLLMIWLLGLLLKGAHDLQSSGTLTLDAALGATGEVYASIPAAGTGRGQVRLVLRDRLRIFDAVATAEALPRSARIRVLAVNDDNTLTVTRA